MLKYLHFLTFMRAQISTHSSGEPFSAFYIPSLYDLFFSHAPLFLIYATSFRCNFQMLIAMLYCGGIQRCQITEILE